MRAWAWMVCMVPLCGHANDWRTDAIAAARAGDAARAVELAEAGRAAWLAPHLARAIRQPDGYIGWVAGEKDLLVYRAGDAPVVRLLPRPWWLKQDIHRLHARLAAAGLPGPGSLERLHAALIAPVEDWLAERPEWLFATDGFLVRVPFALLTDRVVVHAASRRSAALSALRVERARARPPTLFAYARNAPGDPDALPAARAEIELAAAALDAPAFLLSGPGAFERLQRAAYDGSMSGARYVLFAAHAGPGPDGADRVQLHLAGGSDARFTPDDTLHLRLNAELVVLSACETGLGAGSGFARAGVIAGAGMTLLTRWRIEDAAAAQFVAALFAEIATGHAPAQALARTREAFRASAHGDTYSAPFYWAGWQLWGG